MCAKAKTGGSSPGFDPLSFNAQFATIVQQLKQQDAERWEYQRVETEYRAVVQGKLDKIQEAVDKTNGRVTALEREQWKQRGAVAAIVITITGVWNLLTKK